MQRIIDGAAYNTDTATKIALHRKQGDGERQVTHYRTTQGKDFYHLQNYEGSDGHLQDRFEQVPEGYWHETYHAGAEVPDDTSLVEVRAGDRRIGRKPNA